MEPETKITPLKTKKSPQRSSGVALVGQLFHEVKTNGDINRQGRIIGNPEPGWYYAELFSWITGLPTCRTLIRLEEMENWLFYANRSDMVFSYECGAAYCKNQATEERKRKEKEALTPTA